MVTTQVGVGDKYLTLVQLFCTLYFRILVECLCCWYVYYSVLCQSNSPGCEAGCWPVLMGKPQDLFQPTMSRSLERGEVVNMQRWRSLLRSSRMTGRPCRHILLQTLSYSLAKTSAQVSTSPPLQPPQRSCWNRCMQKHPAPDQQTRPKRTDLPCLGMDVCVYICNCVENILWSTIIRWQLTCP